MTTSVQTFFDTYAAALVSLSAEKIADCYQTPLAVYSDNGIQLVTSMDEVVSFWLEGIKPYQSMAIDKAVPEILAEEKLTKTILTSKVQWTNYSKEGDEIAKEVNFYILSQLNNQLKISGLIIMNE
ncbi:hypothetical protein [Spirosoma sp. KNUC1025]|uniref:hypothetical protein n=1 Tax=Spirosoma sp. KNUC1025 TaxID=2894082 RepID=UPI00386E87FC|nr:hypothetical protein LN737_17095 [Spirosoma sp. KNUC1025]